MTSIKNSCRWAGVLLVSIACACAAADTSSPREHLSLDANWKFHLGDDWPNALRLDKAGESGGPAAEKFNDNSWRTLNLPHDWAIELPFDPTADASHGFKPVGPGFPQNSVGWYRRTFELPAADSGKRIWLTFDGVFRDATVWVNGWLMARHEGGYYPFREDITDVAHFGGRNVITVKVDASKFEGWFYEGAGIYRHVWLDKTAPVAIAPDGIFVSCEFNNNIPYGPGTISIETHLNVFQTNVPDAKILYALSDPDGNPVEVEGLPNSVDPNTGRPFPPNIQIMDYMPSPGMGNGFYPAENGTNKFVDFDFNQYPAKVLVNARINFYPGLRGTSRSTDQQTPPFSVMPSFSAAHFVPELWSPQSPKLYKLVTTVEVDDKVVDQKETEFGIRTFAFDPTNGFLLNGKHYELYGTCNHQDMAGVGAALPDALQYFRVAKLKEFGCNAIRTSHNPPTPELLDACDHLGMIIMDESRLLGSDSENLRKWESQIRRDRNHACVGIWSICNEEPRQYSPEGGRVGLTMQNLVKQMDPTRPVTAAENVGNDYGGLMGALEVRGWNYYPGDEMARYHAEHPDQPNVGTEQGSTVSTRGIYENDPVRGYVSAYDVNAPPWATTAEDWWSYFADRPWLSGGFVWTGFDYRGEPTPYAWPCINSHFGILDVCGFPKDNFYYYQSWWTTNIVLHLLPHWNWAGKEGREIRVDALSNCKQVELFLNDESLGKQVMKPNSKLTWQVKYAPGTLSAKGFDAAGKVIAETKVETTGDAAQIQLTPNRTTISADGEDVSVVTVSVTDARGRIVPTAGNKINFAIEGAGKILGVGNGDPSCHEPDTFLAQAPVKSIPVNGWRWKLAGVPSDGSPIPEYAPDFDDSSWNAIQSKTDGETGSRVLSEGQTAVFRARVNVSEADLKNPVVQVCFGSIDDHGWIFVNNQRVGESHDWSAQPVFYIRQALHAGDNVIAVGVKNDGGPGGINTGVHVDITGRPAASPWSRGVFNGLAQIMVQSTKDAGEIKLTATADGLSPATTTIQTQPGTPRPSVP